MPKENVQAESALGGKRGVNSVSRRMLIKPVLLQRRVVIES